MTIQQFHTFFLLVVNKTSSEYWSHEDIDNFAEIAQTEYFSMLIGNYREYRPGRPVPLVISGQTNRTKEELNPFKETIEFFEAPFNPTTTPYGVTNGVLPLPENFQHMDAVTTFYQENGSIRERPVSIVDAEEWAYRVDSEMVAPTRRDPIVMFDGAGGTLNGFTIAGRQKMRIAPISTTGRVRYFRKPLKPLYSYTLDPSTMVETFDPNTSVDLEWGEVAATNILVRSLQLAGVPGADQMLYQAMTADKIQDE